jgi:uncharacterized protein (TIGR02646 family)
MIKINKGGEPNILVNNKVVWTTELMGYINTNVKVPDGVYNRYNNNEVKAALKTECSNKCMYCESNVSHVSYEHIEHIKPKAKTKYPTLTYEWDNLGLACPICNMNKGDQYDLNLPFINPYMDNPSLYFVAIGHFIYHKHANQRAEITKRIIKLNRPELIEKRLERLESISRLIDKYHSETNLTLKAAIKAEIEIEILDDKPYSFCAKSLYDALMN